MCENCGCGATGEDAIGISAGHETPGHGHEHEHGHDHAHDHGPGAHHGHSHEATHSHAHPPEAVDPDPALAEARRTVEVRRAILDKNDRLAERNRGFFRARGLLVLNVLSAPGSGKTTFLRETVRALAPQLKAGVIVGDLATDNDAQRCARRARPWSRSRPAPSAISKPGWSPAPFPSSTSPASASSSSKMSATSSAPPPTTWAKTCAWSCCRSRRAKTSR